MHPVPFRPRHKGAELRLLPARDCALLWIRHALHLQQPPESRVAAEIGRGQKRLEVPKRGSAYSERKRQYEAPR